MDDLGRGARLLAELQDEHEGELVVVTAEVGEDDLVGLVLDGQGLDLGLDLGEGVGALELEALVRGLPAHHRRGSALWEEDADVVGLGVEDLLGEVDVLGGAGAVGGDVLQGVAHGSGAAPGEEEEVGRDAGRFGENGLSEAVLDHGGYLARDADAEELTDNAPRVDYGVVLIMLLYFGYSHDGGITIAQREQTEAVSLDREGRRASWAFLVGGEKRFLVATGVVGLRGLLTEEGDEVEQAGHVVEPEVDKQLADAIVGREILRRQGRFRAGAILRAVPFNLTPLPSGDLLLVPGWVEERGDRGGGKGRQEGHDDEDGESSGAENIGLKANVLCKLHISISYLVNA